MKVVKCPQCGFVGLADEGFCKSCGWDIELKYPGGRANVPQSDKPGRGLKFKLNVIFAVLAIAAIISGIAVAHVKLTKYFDKTPLYLAAISNSEKFREPVTIRVNRKQIPAYAQYNFRGVVEEKKAGTPAQTAYVLESLGLLTMSVETSISTVSLGKRESYGLYVGSTMISAPGSEEKFADVKSSTLMISLTDKGRQEAESWREVDEPLSNVAGSPDTQHVLPWWRIPIGEREILRVESVTLTNESQGETVMVTFRWRWRPNKLGESFDLSNPVFNVLPPKAQTAVKDLGQSSQTEGYGLATLKKQYGRWECLDVTFPSEMVLK